MTDLKTLVLNCTLTPSPESSSTELLGRQLLTALEEQGAGGDLVRVVDHDVRFGITTDEGGGDAWPQIRQQVLDADIVAIATPVWMGQPSSVTKMVLERLDAELSETDEQGRTTTYDKVGLVAVVGNEDGAHHVSAEVYQGLNDTGFSLAPNAVTYWVGQAMQGTDYRDLDDTPEETASATATAARNAVHLARQLKSAPYPAS